MKIKRRTFTAALLAVLALLSLFPAEQPAGLTGTAQAITQSDIDRLISVRMWKTRFPS